MIRRWLLFLNYFVHYLTSFFQLISNCKRTFSFVKQTNSICSYILKHLYYPCSTKDRRIASANKNYYGLNYRLYFVNTIRIDANVLESFKWWCVELMCCSAYFRIILLSAAPSSILEIRPVESVSCICIITIKRVNDIHIIGSFLSKKSWSYCLLYIVDTIPTWDWKGHWTFVKDIAIV